jgi:hypothetical protein
VPSRFYDPYSASPQFPSLYLSDDALVAMFEAQALYGSPTQPGGFVSAPKGTWTILTVQVQLQSVVDLSDVVSQSILGATAQELTGDWLGYRQRSVRSNVSAPIGVAPTQMLGEALHRDPRALEGFPTLSAKVPYNRNLVVFPTHLGAGAYVKYEWQDVHGVTMRFRVDRGSPGGAPVP